MAYVTLQKYLKNADERVREAAAKVLNKSAEELKQEVLKNLDKQKIKNPTGKLRRSVEATIATAKKPVAIVMSEVYVPAPKQPGKENPAMEGRYKNGVPYGRIIEFSPRINRPFFYTAWYKKRQQIKEDVIKAIGEAWAKG